MIDRIDNKTLKVCYTINNAYVDLCCASIYGIIRRKDPDTKIKFYVIVDQVEDCSKFQKFNLIDNIEVVVVHFDSNSLNIKDLEKCPGGTAIAFIRLVIPDIDVFKNEHKLLYLDADFFARRDISSVYFTDLAGYPIGMVKDNLAILLKDFMVWPDGLYRHDYYFNTGLILMDLDKLREKKWSQPLLEYARHREDPSMNDQHILSNLMHYDTYILPPTFNLSYHNFVRMPNSLIRCVERWNNYHHTRYSTIAELIYTSYFWHFHEDKKEHKKYSLINFIMSSYMNDVGEFMITGIVKPWRPEEDVDFYIKE